MDPEKPLKVFVINLDQRQDRWQEVKTMMSSWEKADYSRFSAIVPDLSSTPKQHYNNFFYPRSRNKVSRYIRGAVGCKMSHYQIISKAQEQKYPYILILEDDACIKVSGNGGVVEKIQATVQTLSRMDPEWWMCYLGGKNLGDLTMTGFSSPCGLEIGYTSLGMKTTHAYLIHERAYETVLKGMLDSGLEVDRFYCWLHQELIRHWKGENKVKIYRTVPGLFTQRDDYSDIQGRDVAYRKIS